MKVFAALVTSAFLILSMFIGSVRAEPSLTIKTYKLDKPIIAPQTLQNGAEGIYLLKDYTWHYGCESQLETVHEAAIAMGYENDWYYMQQIFSHESCVDPGRLNSIGACGLGQAYDPNQPYQCSKLGCDPGDIPCQITWFNDYANRRFHGWANAWDYWQANSNW